jgi:tetratricopeptide (TPR) repeat protein
VLAVLTLAGCGSTPKPAEPPRLKAALEAESDGARRYARGDYATAAQRFAEAARIHASIDDISGALRNRRHLARSELALGHAEAALLALAPAEPGDAGPPALENLLIEAQAQLALGRRDAAQLTLAAAADRCAGACPQVASLHLLQAQAALAAKRAAEARSHAQAALQWLRDKDEANETGNAWRLIAAAQLAGGVAGDALAAAHKALEIDRLLALPEKIARDWLLIGDIRRADARGLGDAAAAYRRALGVANAAGLADIAALAERSLAEIGRVR